MADRAHIPTSPACGQWETLLADALDGLLRPEDEATFAGHMAGCAACTALFEEARKGREWLEFLSPEPEVPAGLLDRILAQTGPGQVAGYGLIAGEVPAAVHVQGRQAKIQAWQKPGIMGQIRRFAEPRLMMTAAMVFFSIALTLNLTGVRLGDLRMADFRPAAIRAFMERRITTASVPIIRYYDHLRFVYEVESRMRELRGTEGEGQEGNNGETRQNNTTPNGPGESQRTPVHKDGGSRIDPPQRSGRPQAAPAENNLLREFQEASLTLNEATFSSTRAFRRLQNGITWTVGERSQGWIA